MSIIARLFALAWVPIIFGCTVDATGFATDFNEVHEASIRASTAEARTQPEVLSPQMMRLRTPS